MSAVTEKVLTLEESKRLVELERTIERGLKTFIEVGEALTEIRDSRLYLIEHTTFEAYCRDKWKMERRHVYRLIDGATVAKNVSHGTHSEDPRSERQVRPLTKLDPDQQPAAWERAVEIAEGDQPTAKQVEQAVKTLYPVVEDAGLSQSAIKAGEEAEADGEKLWKLKSAWKKCGKRDRQQFVAWERSKQVEQAVVSTKMRTVLDVADQYWYNARNILENIHPRDASRDRVLREVIAYCETAIRAGEEAESGHLADGLRLADKAIAILSKISQDDLQRKQAVRRIEAWLSINK